MNEQTVAIHMPESLYQRLQRLARVTQRPLESLALQTLDANLPAIPENLSLLVREQLAELETLDDASLWQVAESQYEAAAQPEYSDLLQKNAIDRLTPAEQEQLEAHYEAVNRLSLAKGYAYVLLKWRGYSLPSLSELSAQA